jgi:hypothetical protein
LAGPDAAASQPPPPTPRAAEATTTPPAESANVDAEPKDVDSPVNQESLKSGLQTPPASFKAIPTFRLSRSSLLSSTRRSLGDPVRPVKCYHVGQGMFV